MALRPLSASEQERVDAQLAAHPYLEPRTGERTGGFQASRNARLILKRYFPLIPFRVQLLRSSTDVTLLVSWPLLAGAPAIRDVSALLAPFEGRRNDLDSETVAFCADVDNMAFRRAFGSVSHVAASVRKPTPEETATWLARSLPRRQGKGGTERRRL